jgi:apolipoprotein N-acyltransferase
MLAWVALVPALWLWYQARSVMEGFGPIASLFLLTYALAFFWPTLHTFNDHGVLAVAGLIVWPVAMTVPFSLASVVRRYVTLPLAFALLVASAVGIEWLLAQSPIAWPWTRLGTTQASLVPVLQIAALGGPLALSLWLWLVNGAVFAALVSDRPVGRLGGLLLAGGLVALVWSAGVLIEDYDHRTGRFDALIVDPGVSTSDWADPYNRDRVRRLQALTDSMVQTATKPPSLIVWPSEALPVFAHASWRQQMMDDLAAWTEGHQTPVLTGAVMPGTMEDPWGRTVSFHRSAVMLRPGQDPSVHHQRHLMPWIEDARGVSAPEGLFHRVPPLDGVTRFEPGPDTAPVRFRVMGIGTIATSMGAEGLRLVPAPQQRVPDVWMVQPHVAAWQTGLSPSALHAHAKIRAVALRRPVITVANGRGITVVNALGRVTATSERGERAVIASIPHGTAQSLYARYPRALPILALLVALSVLAVTWQTHRRIATIALQPTRGGSRAEVDRIMQHLPH